MTSVGAATCGTAVWNSDSKKVDFTTSTTLGVCSFIYTVTDGIQSSSFTVSVTVTNIPPVVTSKWFTIQWRQHVAGFDINLLTGASDADSDTVSLVFVGSLSNSNAGSVDITNTTNARITGLSNSQFFNDNVTFAFTVTDGDQTTSGFVNLRVTNIAAVANNDAYTIIGKNPQIPVLYAVMANDSDSDVADRISLKSLSHSGSGVAFLSATNISYTPPSGYVGFETLNYIITDGIQDTSATVTFTTINSVPIANPDYATVKWNQQVTLAPLSNNFDVDTQLTYVVTQVPKGTATIIGNNLVYTPSQSQSYTLINGVMQNNDTFYSKLTDNYGLSSSDGQTTEFFYPRSVVGGARSVGHPVVVLHSKNTIFFL